MAEFTPASISSHAPSTLSAQQRRALINVLAFQVSWFAAVLGAANGMVWLGLFVIGMNLTWHLLDSVRPERETLLIMIAAAFGTLFEFIPFAMGWIDYPGQNIHYLPVWMIALWMNFATVLNVSLRGVRHRFVLLGLLGAVGGPLAYWGGASLGAMAWLQPAPLLVYLALGWALLTPAMARLAMKLDGYAHGA